MDQVKIRLTAKFLFRAGKGRQYLISEKIQDAINEKPTCELEQKDRNLFSKNKCKWFSI